MNNSIKVAHLKATQKEYQDVLDDDLPFLVTKQELNIGDRLVLHESDGRMIYPTCPRLNENCPYWAGVEQPEHKGEKTALSNCKQVRDHCYEYMDEQYTGRACVLSVKKVFELQKTRECALYAFTFRVIKKQV